MDQKHINETAIEQCLPIDNVVNIASITALHTRLKAELERSASICLDASSISNITTPGIQLILSLYKHAQENSLKFTIQHPSEALKTSLEDLGLAGNEIITTFK